MVVEKYYAVFFSKNLYLSIDKYPMGVYITNYKEKYPTGV